MSIQHDIGQTSPDSSDPQEVVRRNRELFERLAQTDLPIAPYAQNALDEVDNDDGEPDE